MPGEVLVDVGDSGLLAAVADESLFEAEDPRDPASAAAFADLHRLPRIAHLTGLKDHPAALAIREKIRGELRAMRRAG
jgi:hypothetical protein